MPPSRPLDRATTLAATAVSYARRAPASLTLLGIITFTSMVLLALESPEARHVLHHHSSNLKNLLDLDIRVMVTSAFWLDDTQVLGQWAVLFLLVLVPAELWLGTKRWLLVFGAGHVGATVVTLTGIWVAIHTGQASERLAHAVDVGVSYGFFAVLAVATYRLPRRWRWPFATALLGYLAASFLYDFDFTDGGHLAAAFIGLALYPAVRSRMVAEPEPTPLPVASEAPGLVPLP